MKRMWLTAAVLATAAASTASGKSDSVLATAEYTVNLRGQFFEHAKGTFDTQDDAIEIGGWNAFVSTPIAMVNVQIAGAPFPLPKGITLEFTARTRSRTLEHRWVRLSDDYFSESGQITIPFLLYGLACDPVDLTAKLRVGPKTQTVRRTMPMACGE